MKKGLIEQKRAFTYEFGPLSKEELSEAMQAITSLYACDTPHILDDVYEWTVRHECMDDSFVLSFPIKAYYDWLEPNPLESSNISENELLDNWKHRIEAFDEYLNKAIGYETED